jgi:hypothetical protein
MTGRTTDGDSAIGAACGASGATVGLDASEVTAVTAVTATATAVTGTGFAKGSAEGAITGAALGG